MQNSRLISNLMISTALIAAATPAYAVDALETPTGGDVVAGSATINLNAPGQLTIDQSSDRTVINWDSFNIGQDASTRFNQPNQNSLAVNRVTGAGTDPTQILGTLSANGRVMVLDRNGVVFGKNARIDVGGIIASSGDVDTAQVMSGSDKIDIINNGGGAVENNGTITVAEGGLAALVAPTVRNNGTINARVGRVGLASGDKVTVDLYGDNLIEMEVNGTAQHALVEQNGTINAEGGVVQISASTAKDVVDNVVNLNGVTNVSSVSQQGGRIILSGGTVNVAGTANASGTRGGSVHVSARNLNMASTAKVTADSTTGEEAGRIDLLASDSAKFDGTISAVGAKGTGFVETSANTADFGDAVKVMATDQWLIDPLNITIGTVLELALELQLNFFGDAVVSTPSSGPQPGNIIVDKTIDWATNNSLTLNAYHNIILNAGGGFVNTGAGNITLNADNNVLVAGNGIHTNGGDITINSRAFRLTGNEVNANGGDILIDNTDGFEALANSIKTSGLGTIELNQNKDSSAFLSSNTIQNAVSAISNSGLGHNIINVGAGNWNENVVVDRRVWLRGANAGIDGSSGLRGAESTMVAPGTAFTVTANGVHINGFAFDGVTTGVAVNGANFVRIRNNLFTNVTGTAIELNNANYAFIARNAILGAGVYGISAVDSDNLRVARNTIRNTGSNAIFVNSSDNATIRKNIISNTGSNAIYVLASKYAQILSNYVGYLDKGITSAGANNIHGDGILLQYSNSDVATPSVISGNHVTDTKSMAWDNGSGIEVLGSSYVAVAGNTITNTGWDSIRALSLLNSTITNNDLSNATRTGIYIGSSNGVMASGNVSTSDNTLYGIHVYNSKNTSLINNTLSNIAQDGVFLENNTGYTLVSGNTITNTGDDGIAAIASNNVTLQGNRIAHTGGNGIEANTLTGATVINRNTVDNTGSDGIYTTDTSALTITNNSVGFGAGSTINGDGIFVEYAHGTAAQHNIVQGNRVTNTLSPAWDKGSGIHISGSYYVDVGGTGFGEANYITHTAWDGIRTQSVLNSTVVGNVITNVTRTGIYLGSDNNVVAALNFIDGTSTHFGIHGDNSRNLIISGNMVLNTAQDGIMLNGVTGTNRVNFNSVLFAGDDGIAADGVDNLTMLGNLIVRPAGDGIDASNVNNLTIGNGTFLGTNRIFGAGANGVLISNVDTASVVRNFINNAANDGISTRDVSDLVIGDNTVNTAGAAGIHVAGKTYGNNTIYGNTVNNAPVGMQLESGLVDLTGTSNTLNGGDVGLRFVGGNVDLLGNTIGTTVFNGQGTYYVELLNGALYAPGTPTLEDGLNATYDGLTPALTAGVLTLAQQTQLEDMFWHFNDDATVGLFFFGSAPLPPATLTFQDQDAFNTFAAFAPPNGRVGLTITGLPRIGGGTTPPADLTNPDVLNTLSPAAGGEPQQLPNEPTAEQVASISPAAGGQNAACWSDATSIASGGGTANFDFATDPGAALSAAANCGNTTP